MLRIVGWRQGIELGAPARLNLRKSVAIDPSFDFVGAQPPQPKPSPALELDFGTAPDPRPSSSDDLALDFAASAPATDPSIVSRSVGDALVATAIGFGVSVLGVCLVCIAIFAFRFTPPWLRSTLIAASLLWLIAFPVGTVIAVIAIVILVRKRHVFAAPRNT